MKPRSTTTGVLESERQWNAVLHGKVASVSGPVRRHCKPGISSHRIAFTLIEIVLALGLTSVVTYLLLTAVELYMVRVDSSRSRVESAQLARTLLDRMASDLTAARLFPPPSGAADGQGGAGGSAAGLQQAGASEFSPPDNSFSGGTSTLGAVATTTQGLYGAANQFRIDRGAYPNWQRAAREVDPQEVATVADMPASIRYFLVEGDPLSAQRLAERGVEEETSSDAAGLYREIIPTAASAGDANSLGSLVRREGALVELLAPEIVKLELSYWDGSQWSDAWDTLQLGSLPVGVEIRLTIHEPALAVDDDPASPQDRLRGQQYRENELVEYVRFVRLPGQSPSPPAEPLLPAAGNQGASRGGQMSGQGPNGAVGGFGQPGGGDGAGP